VTDAETLRQRMVDGLAARGELDPWWRTAFTEVPRHAFLPDTVWCQNGTSSGNDLIPMRRADDPERWLELAYANAPVNTQVDDGNPVGEDGSGFEVTSSASMPAVMAQMLTALDLRPGMRALEIGTGTGYNAALLAHRLGADNVVSVEVDPAVAAQARRALADSGYGAVTVVTGNGADGYRDGAPYDRVLATVAATDVPYPWVAQTRPGGRVLLPWTSVYHPSGLLTLTVAADGSATGRIGDPASFMRLRAQRVPRRRAGGLVADRDTTLATVSTTEVHPYHVAANRDAATAIGLRVPNCQYTYSPQSSEAGTLWLVDQWSGSWATVDLTADPPYEVRQGGDRKLWDEVDAAYRWWLDVGKPAVGVWRFTITPSGQRVELTEPLV